MAVLNGNNAHLDWDGTVLNTYWTDELSNETSANTEDVTSASGATHIQRNSALIDGSFSFSVVYDVDDIDTYKALLEPGKKAVLIYGPEGNAVGKPKHEGSVILTDVSHGQAISKTKIMFELSFEQADTPVSTVTGALAGTF